MIAYSIEQALVSKLFKHIVVSTDSDEIMELAIKYGAEAWFKRPDELATDTAAKLPVIHHAFLESEHHFNEQYDYLIDLDATSPLRNPSDITNAFQLILKDDYDNLVTGMPARRSPYFNLIEVNKKGEVDVAKKSTSPIVRRQDAPRCFDMNASIYIWKRNCFLNQKGLFTKRTGLYIMPEERSIDIDSEVDFKLVELLMKEKNDENA